MSPADSPDSPDRLGDELQTAVAAQERAYRSLGRTETAAHKADEATRAAELRIARYKLGAQLGERHAAVIEKVRSVATHLPTTELPSEDGTAEPAVVIAFNEQNHLPEVARRLSGADERVSLGTNVYSCATTPDGARCSTVISFEERLVNGAQICQCDIDDDGITLSAVVRLPHADGSLINLDSPSKLVEHWNWDAASGVMPDDEACALVSYLLEEVSSDLDRRLELHTHDVTRPQLADVAVPAAALESVDVPPVPAVEH